MVVQLKEIMHIAFTHIRIDKEHPLSGLSRY